MVFSFFVSFNICAKASANLFLIFVQNYYSICVVRVGFTREGRYVREREQEKTRMKVFE